MSAPIERLVLTARVRADIVAHAAGARYATGGFLIGRVASSRLLVLRSVRCPIPAGPPPALPPLYRFDERAAHNVNRAVAPHALAVVGIYVAAADVPAPPAGLEAELQRIGCHAAIVARPASWSDRLDGWTAAPEGGTALVALAIDVVSGPASPPRCPD